MAETGGGNSGAGGGWMQAAMSGLITGVNAISKGGPKRQYKYNKRMAKFQNQLNRENAEWVLAQNRELLAEQRQYDSPQEQMNRYVAAGLNPHLIYDKVAGTSTPINMGSLPAVHGGNIDTSYSPIGSDFMQAELAQSQMGVSNQKIAESKSRQEVLEAQEQLIEANPFMRPGYVDSLVSQMEATAALKQQEKRYMVDFKGDVTSAGIVGHQSAGIQKMALEIELLEQKYNLSKLDQKEKAAVIESKAWENDIKEVQAKWLKDGEITPQHIYQGIMMLLMRLR